MAWVAVAVAGSTLLGSVISGGAQSDAAAQGSAAQVQSAQLGIDEQKRQFDAVQKILSPYVTAGTGALTGQQNIIGQNGPEAQQKAYADASASPGFGALAQQGEDAILANASATGGLRGGNVQGALAQFRPALLSAYINDQYSKLGGLTSLGQNSAAGVGNAGLATGNQVTQLLAQQGAAQAGAAVANGRATTGVVNGIQSAVGTLAAKGFGAGVSPVLTTNGLGFGTGTSYGNQDLGQYF